MFFEVINKKVKKEPGSSGLIQFACTIPSLQAQLLDVQMNKIAVIAWKELIQFQFSFFYLSCYSDGKAKQNAL